MDRFKGRLVLQLGRHRIRIRLTHLSLVVRAAVVGIMTTAVVLPANAQVDSRPKPFTPTTDQTRFPVRRLADGVYAIPGDTGKGVEGRPNAGFVVTDSGVVVVGGIASPAQGRAVLRAIATVTKKPVTYLVLYAHHPDMHFGAIVFRRAGAKIVAHPNLQVLAREAGENSMLADWVRVVGLTEMLTFEYADTPDVPVTTADTLRLGGPKIVIWHPGDAHSAGDLMLWLPESRVLFTGDVIVADGVPMMVDGSSEAMLHAFDEIDALQPRVVVPGHGAIPGDPAAMLASNRDYVTTLRRTLRAAVEQGTPMRKAMANLPPVDELQPVSLHSRQRRNAARVYTEMERAVMGLPGADR